MSSSITIAPESQTTASLAEIRQVSVGPDDDVSAVNELLAEGWQLVHIGHAAQHIVYVLGKPAESSRRRTGFLS